MTDMTKEEINERIAELQAQRAEIERKEHEQAEVERKKKEEEKEKELAAIKNVIKAFNEKYNEYYSLANNVDDFIINFKGKPASIGDEKFLDYLRFLVLS